MPSQKKIVLKKRKKDFVSSKKKSYQNKKLYTKQRNFCVTLQKTKKKHHANLHRKDIADNKQLWTTVKSLFSGKSKSNENITLAEDNKVICEDKGNAELLNSFFSNAVKNLKIPEFSDSNPLAENILLAEIIQSNT